VFLWIQCCRSEKKKNEEEEGGIERREHQKKPNLSLLMVLVFSATRKSVVLLWKSYGEEEVKEGEGEKRNQTMSWIQKPKI
jgi:hypothetical protein